MANYDLELLVLTHLDANRISKKTLLEAVSIYEETDPIRFNAKEHTTEDAEQANGRGRPPHIGISSIVFYLYGKELLSSGKLITNQVLCETVELIRLEVKRIYEADPDKKEVPDEFRNPVKLSAIKTWRRQFESLRANHHEKWKDWFDHIERQRQKLKS